MVINIEWKSTIINSKIENQIIQKYIKKGYFGKIDIKENKYAKIIYSFRKNYLREHLIKNYWKIKSIIHKINKELFKTDILFISKKYNYPPVTILRLIMENNGFSKKKISNILTKKESLKKKFCRKQLNIALENDITADINQSKQLESSRNFEMKVNGEFDKHNIKYLTEEQLRKKGTTLTPDLLLEEPIKINGVLMHWIDAKDFYGSNLRIITRGLNKQSSKYNDKFGKGAFVFHHGFSEKLNIKNTLLLSL